MEGYIFSHGASQYIDEASELSERCGIYESGKTLDTVILSDEDDVVGCLWIYNDDDIFDFDICIDKNHRGKNLADNLVQRALDRFRSISSKISGLTMQVEVVNPTMVYKLKEFGFYSINEIGSMHIMSHD